MTPYEADYKIVFEDEFLLVIDKPAGLTVHPGAGNYNQTLANALYSYLGYAPYLVHRLDKDTSGLMLVAKKETTQRKIIDQFQAKTINREYLALCLVTPRSNRQLQKQPDGRIETIIGRDPKNRLRMSVINEEARGKIAITNWRVEEVYSYALLVRFKLETGRTHQIRVHADYLGSPIIGDPVYGNFDLLPRELGLLHQKLNRQFLHAEVLSFNHPESLERLSFCSELPEDLRFYHDKFKLS